MRVRDSMERNFVTKALAWVCACTMAVCTAGAFTGQTALVCQAEGGLKISGHKLNEYAQGIVSYEKSVMGISENENLFSGDFLANAGKDVSDWFVIGISQMGPSEDYTAYYNALEENISALYETPDRLDRNKATEWHRVILSVLACGKDPTDVGGIDLVEDGIYGRGEENSPGKQGLNGWIWSLIALDSLDWETPENAEFDRGRIIDEILSAQLGDGGFSVDGTEGDVDMTAMALQAFSPYAKTDDRVGLAVEKALDFLSGRQGEDGGFGSCESDAQVLVALCSLGIDQSDDERFVKDKNVLDSLLEYRCADGGFSHEKGGESSSLSSAQALLGIAAAVRYENGGKRLYDFTTDISEHKIQKLDVGANRSDEVQKEINELNSIIMDGFYPFEDIPEEKFDELEEIYNRANALPENEREKITGYEELCKAYEEMSAGGKSSALWISAGALAVGGVIAAAVRFRRKKEENASMNKEE